MKKTVFILFFILTLTNNLRSQKLIASTSSSKVTVGETFQIQFSLNTGGTNFKAPNLSDFNVYSGPNQSTSMSYSNGVMSQSVILSYILAAKKEGKITIGPASVSTSAGTIQSNSMVIEVTKGATNSGSQSNTNQATQPASAPTSGDVGENLFAKIIVNKTKAYQGEEISVTLKVYTRYQLRGFTDVKFPDYSGFWSQDIPGPKQMELTNEIVNGINYQVVELRRSYIFAQKSGKLEISPLKVACVILKSRKPRDIFEQMRGNAYDEVEYTVKSVPVVIDVTPLPETNKPDNFSGAVGEYSFKTQLNKDKVKADDGVNLIVTLTGKGNIKLVDPVKIPFPEDFETYDPKTSENINVTKEGVSGTKTFDYLFIPRHEGDYKIDQINFSYFDPVKKEYVTLPSPEFDLHVDKGNGTSAIVVGSSSHQEEPKVLGNDIRYIKTRSTNLKPKDTFFFGSPLFISGLAFPFLAFIGFVFFRRKNIEQSKDEVAVKSRKATKMARKRLSLAEQHLKSNNKELFYIEIFRSLYGYISDKLNIPVADLNKEHISETLKSRNVNESIIEQFIKILDNCEYARYAPSAVSGDLKSIYDSTVELITKIENEIR